jgi:hypothetical protein
MPASLTHRQQYLAVTRAIPLPDPGAAPDMSCQPGALDQVGHRFPGRSTVVNN